MTLLVVVAVVYSCCTVYLYPCEETFDYSIQVCGGACYQLQPIMGQFDLAFTVFMPLFLITLFNIILVARVLYQKRQMQQKNVWKKNIHMLVQLFTITLVHYFAFIPTCILLIVTVVEVPAPQLIQELEASWVLLNLIYIAVLVTPITCTFAFPELREKINEFIHQIRQQQPLASRIYPSSRSNI